MAKTDILEKQAALRARDLGLIARRIALYFTGEAQEAEIALYAREHEFTPDEIRAAMAPHLPKSKPVDAAGGAP